MNSNDRFYNSSYYYQSDDGLRLHFRDLACDGSPFTIVCLPGLTRNSRDFENLASQLADTYRVICPDLRGRGLSAYDLNWRNYHPLTYAKDIWSLLDHLNLEKVVIIGTSLGGLIAMTMAHQDSNRITGVVLNDIGPEIDPRGLQRIKGYTGKLPPVNNWQQACEQTKKVYGPTLKGLNEDQWLELAKRAYKLGPNNTPVADMDNNIGKAIAEVGAQKGDPWELFDSLANIPTMVLRGEHSDILSKQGLANMHSRNPKLMSATIPLRGHVPLLDEPTSLKAIYQLLESVRI